MWTNTWEKINDWFNEATGSIKDFFLENSRNVLLWIGIILFGLILFEWVYNKLHRD